MHPFFPQELAKKKLAEAIASRDPARLRSAIQKASGLCDVAEAKRVLAEEEAGPHAPRHIALSDTFNGMTFNIDFLKDSRSKLKQL